MSVKKPEDRIFTVPNILSVVRIMIIPVYVALYLSAEEDKDYYIAAGVMAGSMITDALDGVIARKFNLITTLGKVLDPIADKLTQAVVLLCIAIKFKAHVQLWIMIAVFAIKELFMFVAGYLCIRKGKMLNGALMAGKVCTTVLFVGMALFMLFPRMSNLYIWVITMLCTVAMLVSLGFYVSTYMGKNHGVEIKELRSNNNAG